MPDDVTSERIAAMAAAACAARSRSRRASRARSLPRSRASPPRRSFSRSKPSRELRGGAAAGTRPVKDPAAHPQGGRGRDPPPQAVVGRADAFAAGAHRAGNRRSTPSFASKPRTRWRPPRRPTARSRRGAKARCWRAARPQGHVLLGRQAGGLRLQGARGLDRAGNVDRDRPAGGRRVVSPRRALHMSEFAYSPTGHNSYLGPAHNPWDPSRITGGSSSGSGAAVAAPSPMPRSAPIPAARSGCRRISAG